MLGKVLRWRNSCKLFEDTVEGGLAVKANLVIDGFDAHMRLLLE